MQVEQNILDGIRRSLRQHVAPHRHSALLVAIVIAFAIRPLIGDTVPSTAAFSLALVVLLLMALYNICRERATTVLIVAHDTAALAGADQVLDMREINRATGQPGDGERA